MRCLMLHCWTLCLVPRTANVGPTARGPWLVGELMSQMRRSNVLDKVVFSSALRCYGKTGRRGTMTFKQVRVSFFLLRLNMLNGEVP